MNTKAAYEAQTFVLSFTPVGEKVLNASEIQHAF